MRALFLVSGGGWSAHARAFVVAARGLRTRGHDALVACVGECPVHVRAATSDVPVLSLDASASRTSSTMRIRRALKDREFDVVFVHTDAELVMASSAVLLGRSGGRVIRRIPPFALASEGKGARFARRIAPTGLLFSTEADRAAARATSHRLPAALAPLAVDIAEHDAVAPDRGMLGVPAGATTVVCVYDWSDRRRILAPMRVLALLANRHPELHLVMVGTGEVEELRMAGASLGINARVTYLGARDDELAVLRSADVGWIAADSDAAAFAALDFMAFRVPVVMERAPLAEHYVTDGIGGLLLPRSDADATPLAAAVAAFLAQPERRAAMGRAARARLEREFPYDAMLRGFEEAAAAVTSPPARGAPQAAV